MKKSILCLSMLLLALIGSANIKSMCRQLNLQVRLVDPTTVPHTPIPRTPISIPSISIEGNELTFLNPCDGCTLQLVNAEGDVEYSIVIPLGTKSIVLPNYLSGEYELQIIRGQYCFYCTVEL